MGPGGPDLVPTAADWSDRDVIIVTTHFGLVLGLFCAPKRARFGPKCPFWRPRRSSEGPRGPDLVPTAANWSAWVRLIVTTHLGWMLGIFVRKIFSGVVPPERARPEHSENVVVFEI